MSRIFVLAVCALNGSLEDAARDLASLSEKTPYEARLKLAVGFPAIVLTTPDRERALEALARLRAPGHDVVAFDSTAVVPSVDMVALRRFQLTASELRLLSSSDEGRVQDTLPYEDIAIILRAVHRRGSDTSTTVETKKFSVGRAVLSGGLVMRKASSETVRSREDERESVLYLFRRSGRAPWILRATEARYPSELGATTSLAGFEATLASLRSSAPLAGFDDRLVRRRVSEGLAMSIEFKDGTMTASSDAEVDLLAHVLAMLAARAA